MHVLRISFDLFKAFGYSNNDALLFKSFPGRQQLENTLYSHRFFGGLVSSWSYAGVVVIGHDLMKEKVMDKTVLSRIYTGRAVQFAGEPVLPVNLQPGNSTRAYFMQTVLLQSDDDYVAYWIVRRAIGKGVSPLELDSPQEVIKHVRSHPGAIGYVDETLVVPGVKVILSLP